MTRTRRPSPQTVALVLALAAEPTAWHYGYELVTELGIKSGSLYPILMRLADRGLLDAAWETGARPGRPPRHLYRLTKAGLEFARGLAPAAAQARGRARLQEA
jgi:DNA-binding PadR family transcriptional regulator